MKNLRNNLNSLCTHKSARFINSIAFKGIAVFSVILLLNSGCKKTPPVNSDRDFGYAKLTIECAGKCDVSYGTGNTLSNNINVNKSEAIYAIRYQRNYELVVNVTPREADQNVNLNVYSREGKQIFRNNSVRKVNETWTTKILIP